MARTKTGWRKRIGWPMTGIVMLPFDRHHVFEQLGGAALAIAGLAWATVQP